MATEIRKLPIYQCLGVQDPEPDKTALIFVHDDGTDEIITHKKIYENTNRITRALMKQGIGKGDAFALLMRNHPEFLYSMFSALSLGAVAVPIDPRTRGRKLAFMISNTRAKAIFVSDIFLDAVLEIKEEIPDTKVAGVLSKPYHRAAPAKGYPLLSEILETESPDPPVSFGDVDFSLPVQIIHTSGTTGDPKGVVLRADRFLTYGFLADLVWQYQADDIPYTGLSLTHGNAQAVTVFPALAKGLPAVISERFTKSRIWDICRKYGCTTFSLLGGMMSGIYNETPKPDDADNPVRVVISAGTPVSVWRDFEKRFDVKIHEWYGAVEGGLAHNPPGTGPVGSFGKPLAGFMEMKVVDENDNELAPGEKGELVSRMIQGETEVNYLGKEKESREKTRGGWLRSGDICHRDENGFFYFDFRKGGGLRRQGDFIQPDLIEKVIGEHPSVSEVCVYGIPAESGAPGESDLVAAIAPFPGTKADIPGIRERCLHELEKNALPAFFQIVDTIPKTNSEKHLDRVLKEAFSKNAENVMAFFS